MNDIDAKLAVCHYCFHRTWKAESWDVDRLADEVKKLNVGGIDFHAGLLGNPDGAADKIQSALDRTGLTLTGFSLSTNFNLDTPAAIAEHTAATVGWLEVAAAVKAPVCRVFGGHVDRWTNPDSIAPGLVTVVAALKNLADIAGSMGLTLALENHGGLPGTSDEVIHVLESVNSPALRSTVDIGNFMAAGQDCAEACHAVAKYASYVHIKDNQNLQEPGKVKPCTVGQGDVDVLACLKPLKAAGYDGPYVLEYEGSDDEAIGIRASLDYLRRVLTEL